MASANPTSGDVPRVTVLLATHNGLRWLPEQLASILAQDGVQLTVTVSDDMSSDGSHEWLLEQAASDPRITVLPRVGPSGGAAPNFYRLLRQLDVENAGFVAFSDQDDIWQPGKLASQAALLRDGSIDGVSSNVTAFSADGSRHLIRKSYPQRKLDYLFESPGPGCTFLFSQRLAATAQTVLRADPNLTTRAEFHDWLLYVLCRAQGWRWLIDDSSTVDYRQHDNNAFGANIGFAPIVARLQLIREDWHRRQAIVMTEAAVAVATPQLRPELVRLLALLSTRGLRARLTLAGQAGQMRRRVRDREIIRGLIAMGIW
jgi:rhamnosyltransferase